MTMNRPLQNNSTTFSEFDLLASYAYESTQPVLIDVGAHHGRVSRMFAKRGWQVVAFEPEVRNREVFEQALRRFKTVVCIPKAVSDVTGQRVPFYVSDEHYGIHSLKPFHSTHRLAYEVETVRLNDVLEELDISSATLLKVDIEGADFLALKGFDFAKYCPELVMIEFMDDRSLQNFGYTHHDVAAYMSERGYVTFVSEWEAIKQYARENEVGDPHVWIQCVRYPLDHDPEWGNLIFVPDKDAEKFSRGLQLYLNDEKGKLRNKWIVQLRQRIRKIPGVRALYAVLKDR